MERNQCAMVPSVYFSRAYPIPTMTDGRIYVGNLPIDVQERDIEDIFFKCGKIRDIELKNNRGTIPFAFVRFEDPRDAEDAVYGRNGYEFGGSKLRVEYPRSSGATFSGPMGGGEGGGPKGRFGPPTRRSEFRVIVTGLPPSGSWQDLKDHMREAGDVCFADVQRDGEGVVEFVRREDMEYALRRLDRTEFRSHQVSTPLHSNTFEIGVHLRVTRLFKLMTEDVLLSHLLCMFFRGRWQTFVSMENMVPVMVARSPAPDPPGGVATHHLLTKAEGPLHSATSHLHGAMCPAIAPQRGDTQ
uniref:Serine/arginine-rich splicing factor 9 n=2 Tax=Hucho hucho TaxID=62062 RepID=A0A4W5N423_9TELE